MFNHIFTLSSTMACLLFSTGCNLFEGDDESERSKDTMYAPIIQPENFVEAITNPYWPMKVGNTWKYVSTDEDVTETIDVEVLAEKKSILDIPCTVVRDRVYENGKLIEDTYDWYAQDKAGNVWYMGENSLEMDGDKIISHEGSWEAGVDGAEPGIVMWAEPFPGLPYRQEYYFEEAEDWGQVVEVLPSLEVRGITYQKVVKTKEWTPLEEGFAENKFYAPGIGVIKEQVLSGGTGLVLLREFKDAGGR